MGVKTIQITAKKGGLAGALMVREHFELVFISQNGMVQRTNVKGISRYGRASQGVKLMNIRDDDSVSAVALVAESQTDTEAKVQDELDANRAAPAALRPAAPPGARPAGRRSPGRPPSAGRRATAPPSPPRGARRSRAARTRRWRPPPRPPSARRGTPRWPSTAPRRPRRRARRSA